MILVKREGPAAPLPKCYVSPTYLLKTEIMGVEVKGQVSGARTLFFN